MPELLRLWFDPTETSTAYLTRRRCDGFFSPDASSSLAFRASFGSRSSFAVGDMPMVGASFSPLLPPWAAVSRGARVGSLPYFEAAVKRAIPRLFRS